MLTPLLLAVTVGNQRCVEVLANDPNTKIDTKDANGNNVFHMCAEFNNVDSLKYLCKQYPTQSVILMSGKNNDEEGIFHIACRSGNLEIIKIVISLLSNQSCLLLDQSLLSKNTEGQTCFHVACIKGFFNIVEYFLKHLKMKIYLEQLDNYSNTALHLATLNGHASIVSLLLLHATDLNAKNEDNATALDLSCRKGYFEISKLLISRYSVIENEHSGNDYPLHVACNEGAYEVVKLLLQKGAAIDQLNIQNKNCLDIAIGKGHREVIKVLLNDPNWVKLVKFSNQVEDDDEHALSMVTTIAGTGQAAEAAAVQKLKHVENPQLCALFESKMWDMLELVLDKCWLDEGRQFDFRILDHSVKSKSKHPLMLIARSGQENLVKHEATLFLLHLKWRFIPRFAFYFNLILFLIYLISISIYSIELAKYGKHELGLISNGSKYRRDFVQQVEPYFVREHNRTLYCIMICIICVNICKEIMQFLMLSKVAFVMSLKNWIENVSYILILISLHTNEFYTQSVYVSLSILASFLIFPLKIQKLRFIGLYVVAFCR